MTFSKKNIESSFKKLKQRKVGRLAWYIGNRNFKNYFLDHYLQLSSDYLKVARLLYKNQFINIALESLLNSIHCFMIRKLLDKKIFITTGEITQLFFNIYSDNKIFKLRSSFLLLEQIMNQRHSFNFDEYGNIFFLKNKSLKNKLIFLKTIRNFGELQIFFNEKYSNLEHK